MVKNLPAMQEAGFKPWVGRFLAEGNGNPLQYSCLKNSWTEEPGRLQRGRKEADITEVVNTGWISDQISK